MQHSSAPKKKMKQMHFDYHRSSLHISPLNPSATTKTVKKRDCCDNPQNEGTVHENHGDWLSPGALNTRILSGILSLFTFLATNRALHFTTISVKASFAIPSFPITRRQ
jgi:hypothetical protein